MLQQTLATQEVQKSLQEIAELEKGEENPEDIFNKQEGASTSSDAKG